MYLLIMCNANGDIHMIFQSHCKLKLGSSKLALGVMGNLNEKLKSRFAMNLCTW